MAIANRPARSPAFAGSANGGPRHVLESQQFSRELLDTLPVNRSVSGFATLTLGANLSPTNQNVGGNQSETSSGGSTVSSI